MAFPSLAVIAKKLSEAQIKQLLMLKRAGPKLLKMEERRKKLAAQLAELDKQIAALDSGAAPKAAKRRGRKPGRKPGRPAKGKPGRKPGRPAKAVAKRGPGRPSKAAKATRPAKAKRRYSPAALEVLRANMAKARAAKAARAGK